MISKLRNCCRFFYQLLIHNTTFINILILDNFPTTERGWERLGEKCGFSEGKLNKLRNRISRIQNNAQEGK